MTDSPTPVQQGLTTFGLTSGAFSSNTVIDLPGGTYNIWGQYGGDNLNAPSTSPMTAVTVTPESTILSLNVTPWNSSAPLTASRCIRNFRRPISTAALPGFFLFLLQLGLQ